MKKILWVSRHPLTKKQEDDLRNIYGNISVKQVTRTVKTVIDIADEVSGHDIIAVVLPLPMQQQLLSMRQKSKMRFALIRPKSRWIKKTGLTRAVRDHAGWEQVNRIRIETVSLSQSAHCESAKAVRRSGQAL